MWYVKILNYNMLFPGTTMATLDGAPKVCVYCIVCESLFLQGKRIYILIIGLKSSAMTYTIFEGNSVATLSFSSEPYPTLVNYG
jgi:hypothetical protein